jgi:hypothetical protein
MDGYYMKRPAEGPQEGQDNPMTAEEVIQADANDNYKNNRRVKPKEHFAMVLRPPMLSDLLYKAATHQGLVNNVDDIGGQDCPEADTEDINSDHISDFV